MKFNLVIQVVKISFLYITKGVMFSFSKSFIFKNKVTLVGSPVFVVIGNAYKYANSRLSGYRSSMFCVASYFFPKKPKEPFGLPN